MKPELDLDALLNRGVAEIIVREELIARLKNGEKFRVYHGIDPTGAELHLGHAVTLWKLRQFQDLGHEVILLIGDFTAQIGDPTGRSNQRVPLTWEQVKLNAQNYKKQASKILDFKSKKNPVRLKFNSQWLSRLNFKEVVQLAMNFTVSQMIERDMFQERIKASNPIGLHEFLYPLMQGYDSVVMDVDLEIGGSDQLFNMLAGRTLMKNLKNKSKLVLTTSLLEGLDGRKMSKSYGNYVAITATPEDMFGKIMSMKDELITKYFELCTFKSKSEISQIAVALKNGANPRDHKLRLAQEIVAIYNGEAKALKARENFVKVFSQGELPAEIATRSVPKGEYHLMDLLVRLKLVGSKSEAGRVIDQGGVKIDNQEAKGRFLKVKVGTTAILIQKGKLHYLKVVGE